VASPPKRVKIRRVPSLQALLGLYRGDEDSTGYSHEGLIREICRKLRPPPATELELLYQLHPGCEPDDLSVYARTTISKAFRKWRLE
jgi:hypothetical protein